MEATGTTGTTELRSYITSNQKARFSCFIIKFKPSITGWSINISATTPQELQDAWIEKYATVHMEVRNTNTRPRRPNKYNEEAWNYIYAAYQRRREALNTFHEEAIETLTASASSAGSEVRSLLSSSSAPVSTSAPASTSAPPPSPRVQEKTLSLTLKEPSSERLVVNDTDISEAFYMLQQNTYQFVKSSSLTLETDVHQILSLSSILLLQNNNRMPQSWIPLLGNGLYADTRTKIIERLNLSTVEFSGDTLLELIETIDKIYSKRSDRLNAALSLMNKASNMTDNINKKLIMSMAQLVQFLPLDPLNHTISETTYITRYTLLLIQPLFDDHDKNIRLDFTFTELANKSASPNSLTFNGNPGFIMTMFPHATDDGVHVGHGEVKPLNTASNHYLVNWDLLRLAIFGKQPIDEHDLVGNMSIHVVAPNIIYYLIHLTADGIYTMTELLRVQVPMSISELSGYAASLSKLKVVLSAFELYCLPKNNNNNNNSNSNSNNSSWTRDSLLESDIDLILDKTRNRKRKNTSGHLPAKR